MPPGVADKTPADAELPAVTLPRAGEVAHRSESTNQHDPEHEHHHHILIEPEEDRWRWRRKIRENKRQLMVYRMAVGILGLILIALGLVSGPIPGPGGIPLVLLGLAVWSSEFEWAHQLMMWFKKELHRYRTWSRAKQVLFSAVCLASCRILGYLYLLLPGPPTWLPGPVDVLLQRLPGL